MDLSESDWEYVAERAAAFVGREWVFARVRSFLAGPPGTFLLRGDPGTGKTAVAARLAQASCGRLDAAGSLPPPVAGGVISAAVFCRVGKATVPELAQRLSDQLAASVDGFADALRATVEAEHGITIGDVHVEVHGDVHAGGIVLGVALPRQDAKLAFSTGVAVPLRRLRERGTAEPIVLLVDAVDEAANVGEVNVFSRLLGNLDDVHLIVTCRPDPSVLSDFKAAAHKLDLIADTPADDDDVRHYIRNRLTGEGPGKAVDVLADRVSGKADGNFLYAFYVTGTLIGSGSLAGMDEKTARGLPLPTGGLAGVYEDFLDRQIAGDLARWARELRPVLAPLAVAQDEGLTTEQLRLVASRLSTEPMTRTAIRDVTRAARQFLDGPAPDGPFRVYHQSFASFLVDPEQNPDFLIDATETHEAIVAAYAATDPLSWDRYARRNLALHASEVGQLDHLLEDARFLVAADPSRLVPYLSAACSAAARVAATVYRQTVHALTDLDPTRRASQLELTAHQFGCRSLATRIADAAPSRPWQTRWSHGGRAAGHQVLTGHTGAVLAVAVRTLPDGAPVIVSGDRDGAVRVWRLADGTPVGQPLSGHTGPVRAVAVGERHGRPVIISGGEDRTVRVWDLESGEPTLRPLVGHTHEICAVAVRALPDGTPVIISGDGNGAVRVWRLADGTSVGRPVYSRTGMVVAMAVGAQPDGTPVIVSGGAAGTVQVWRLADGTPVGQPLHGHTGTVLAVAVGTLPDGTPVVISGSDLDFISRGVVRMWRLADGAPVGQPLSGHTGGVNAVAVGALPDGTPMIVSGGADAVRMWRLADGTPVGEPLSGHDGAVLAVAVGALPDGTPAIVSGDAGGSVRVWRLDDGTSDEGPLSGHDGTVLAVAVGALPDGTPVIVSGAEDETVRVWRLADGTPVGQPLSGRTGVVLAVAVGALPDGTPVIVSGDSGGRGFGDTGVIRVWQLADGAPVGQLSAAHNGVVWAVAVGALQDGTPVIVSGGDDGAVRVWRLADGVPVGEPLTGHDGPVHAVAVGKWHGRPVIVSGGADRTVRLWDLESGGHGTLVGHTNAVHAVAVGALPDGTPVMVSGDRSTVRVWGLADGTPVVVSAGGGRLTVGALPDGTPVIVSGDLGGGVRVWRLVDGTPLVPPLVLSGPAGAIAVDGSIVVTAAGDGIAVHEPAPSGSR
jgi:WD40 repeat protein